MSNLGDEMQKQGMRWFPDPPATFAALVTGLGGQKEAAKYIEVPGNRSKPAHMGVSQRAMERYAAAERGATKGGRGQPRPAGLKRAINQLTAAWKDRQRNRMPAKWGLRGKGMGVDFRGDFHAVSRDVEGAHIKLREPIPPEKVRELLNAWQIHDWETAAQVFNDALFEAYGLNGTGTFDAYGGWDANGFKITKVTRLSLS